MIRLCGAALLAVVVSGGVAAAANLEFLNHAHPVLDAHNCYPYDGRWNDRLRRALDSGFPVSIEQDLAWYVDPGSGKGRVVVAHTPHPSGREPTLRDYFFEQVRPIIEAVWHLLGEYGPWLSTAAKSADPLWLSPIERKPILVVTEDSDAQAKVFYDNVAVGGRLRLFGSAHTQSPPPGATLAQRAHWEATARPAQLLETRAGGWTKADDRRLRALIDYAHEQGYRALSRYLDQRDRALRPARAQVAGGRDAVPGGT